jgi:hypothetical protein
MTNRFTIQLASAAIAFGAVAGCSSSGTGTQTEAVSEVVQHVEAANVPANADLSTAPEATIFFDPGWSEWVQGTLYSGGPVGVVASPERFPQCGVAGPLFAHVRIDGNEPVAYPMDEDQGGWPRATVDVPVGAQRLELWLEAAGPNGCQEWDSNVGANYTFAVYRWQPTLVHFLSDWSERAEGPLVAGGVMVIDYDLARLPECRDTDQYGLPVWDVVAHVRFGNGTQLDHTVTYPVQSSGVTLSKERGLALFPIPDGVTVLDVWFENWQLQMPWPQEGACPAWDSNFGANYHFAVVPPAQGAAVPGWVGSWDFVRFHRDPAEHQGDRDPAYYFDDMAGAEVATWVELQVWIPGVTDLSYASPQDAAQAAQARVLAEAVTDALGGEIDGWGATPLSFERQSGNNFVYSFRFWQLRYDIYHSPAIATGLYQYYARFSTDGGASWHTAGLEGGHARRFAVGPTTDCSLFPDHAPEGCPQAAGIGWAGTWGGLFTHACEHRNELPDPVVFTKSSLGHDCMSLTAEVWVPGLTDVDADPASLRAEVVTNVGFEAGGPLPAAVSYPLVFDGRTGNNYRFRWDVNEHVSRADRGDYHYRFRFSADNGQSWYEIASADGPQGGADRSLWIRNDSLDVEATEPCTGVESWQGATNAFPLCLGYSVDANYDANNCELFVNAFGRGSFSHDGASASWLEAYLRVALQQGELLGAGMWTRYLDDSSTVQERFSLGTEIEPGYYKTGFTYARNALDGSPYSWQVTAVAFFVDVRRPDGQVVRLWVSNHGTNYGLDAIFAVPGYVQGGGITSVEYADESVALFDQKRACQ